MTSPTPSLPIRGTVYGVLLNSQDEWQSAEAHMHQAPYKAPPVAPVLYVKTANTWNPSQNNIAVPADVAAVEVGATLGLVVDAQAQAKAFVLLNDVSLPHTVADQGFYRPPVKYKNLDGFLGVGTHAVAASALPAPETLQLQVHINGVLRQTVDLAAMRRDMSALLRDVQHCMALCEDDVVMLGLGICTQGLEAGRRPHARVGEVVTISAPQAPALGVLRHTLVAAPALEMPA